MKINLFSPHQPPQPCGVGDYSHFLSEALRARGHEVRILSQAGTASIADSSITVVQYTPQLYSSFWECLKILNQSRGKVVFNFHELYYPPSFSPRGILIGVRHWIRFLFLLHLCDQAFFSTAGFYSRWVRRLSYLQKKLSWIPVGSNIPMITPPTHVRSGNGLNLLHFGGAHPTHLYSFIFHAVESLIQRSPGKKISLTLVGVKQEDLADELKKYPQLARLIRFTGYLNPDAVSKEIRGADLVLAPFLDGVTTRRGSVMTALEHGKVVITTFKSGADTDSLPWKDFLDGVDVDLPQASAAYAEKVSEWAMVSLERRESMEVNARAFFLKKFSWQVIAEEYEKRLKAFSRS